MKFRQTVIACFLSWGLSQAAEPASPAAARKEAMARTRATIQAELEAAGGNWGAWYESLRPAWKELNAKVVTAQKDPRTIAIKDAPSWSYLHTEGKPPMFVQTGSAYYLMADNMDPEEFLKTRPSIQVLLAFNRWLKQHDIDLIFVPVPKLVEVYPERVLTNAPGSRILAPHMRKLILQLLDADVETVDLLPEFLTAASSGAGPLYLSSDSHWTQMTQKLTSKLLAQRLVRYPFVQQALKQPQKFKSAEVKLQFGGADYAYLNPEERKQVDDTVQLSLTQIQDSSGRPYEDPEDAPIVMIGDSYVHYFSIAIKKGTGIEALLSRDVNLPVTNRAVGGGTTDSLKEFIRNPEILNFHKVVIWIVTSDMFMASGRWDFVPFPAPRKAAGR